MYHLLTCVLPSDVHKAPKQPSSCSVLAPAAAAEVVVVVVVVVVEAAAVKRSAAAVLTPKRGRGKTGKQETHSVGATKNSNDAG